MSNIMNNRISVIATQAQITAAKAGIQAMNTHLPFLIGLKPEERMSLLGIDVNNKAFTEDAIKAGLSNQDMLPPYLSVKNMQTDLELFEQLDELIILVRQLLEKLQDTQLLAGSEAYMSALILYKLFAAASETGIPGTDTIVAQLRTRFAKQGGSGAAPRAPQE